MAALPPLPALPAPGQNPWYTERNAFDQEVRARLEGYLDPEQLSTALPPGPPGSRGSLWYDSNPANWDPVDVANPQVGDQFLYPVSGDVFRYQGPNNDLAGWLYIGSIAGPKGPPGSVYWANIEDHGAVGDGSTDDRAAIQAAIDTGRPVYIPAKVFLIGAALVLHSGTRIFGDRSASFGGDTQSTIKQVTPSAHGITGVDITEFQMEDVLLVGPGSGTGDGVHLTRSANPATRYVSMSRVYVQDFGQDGISVSNAIVSVFDRVVAEGNGRHGFNFYGVYKGSAGTSCALNGCFANGNGATGFTLNSMVYVGLNGCAAEHQAIDYDIISCQGISFTGCGSEQNQGISWKISDGSLGIGLYSCWSYMSAGIGVLVTDNSRAAVIAGFVENSPVAGATASIKVDDGCRATVITGNLITPTAYAAWTTAILDDGGGAITTYGDASFPYFKAQYGGDFGGGRATSVGNPVDPQDAATKEYVDALSTRLAAVEALLAE